MESSDQLCLPWWDAKINQLGTNSSILEVHDEPLPEAVQHNLVEIFGFDTPVAGQSRSEFIPLGFWNIHSTRIIIWIRWLTLLTVFHMLFLCEPRTILIVFNDSCHIMPGLCVS